jgi:alpha-glucosidase
MLALYRTALTIRPEFGDGPLTWLPAPDGVLAFARADGPVCVVNLAEVPAELPADFRLLLSSGPLTAEGRLPQDTAVWLRTDF